MILYLGILTMGFHPFGFVLNPCDSHTTLYLVF